MSDQFYTFLSNRFSEFLKINYREGDRYFLQLDTQEEVDSLYLHLEKLPESELFYYEHPKGGEYISFKLSNHLGDILIAATTQGVTPDFLVTLRNLVSEGAFGERTGICFITSSELDSLRGGSSCLKKEGMPFNLKGMYREFLDAVNNSKMERVEKDIFTFYLKKRVEGYYDTPSIWDFKDIVRILEKGKIDTESFKNFGLFFDEEIFFYKFSGKEIKDRLDENWEIYSKIQHCTTYSIDMLENFLCPEGVKTISSKAENEEWRNIPFSTLRNSVNVFQEQRKSKVHLMALELSSDTTSYWLSKETDRKISILVFNPLKIPELTLSLEFDKKIQSEMISPTPQSLKYSTRRNKIQIVFPVTDEVVYSKIIYNLGRKITINICCLPLSEQLFTEIKPYFSIRATGGKKGYIQLNELPIGITIGNRSAAVSKFPTDSIFFQCSLETSPVELPEEDMEFQLLDSNAGTISFKSKSSSFRNFPWDGIEISKSVREGRCSFSYENGSGKISGPSGVFVIQKDVEKFLEYEASILNTQLPKNFPDNLKEKYCAILIWFKENKLLPSLTFPNGELIDLYTDFISTYNEKIESIAENQALINQGENYYLGEVGMYSFEGEHYFTPLHPLNISYQLLLNEYASGLKLSSAIQEKLTWSPLLPLLYYKDSLHMTLEVTNFPQWKKLHEFSKSTLAQNSSFISRLTEEKLREFYTHFNFLFPENGNSPFIVKGVNLDDDYQFIKGILLFLFWQIEEKGPSAVNPVTVTFAGNNSKISWYKELHKSDALENILEIFKLELDIDEYSPKDILKVIQQNIFFYFESDLDSYSHIAFFKMSSSKTVAKNLLNSLPSSVGIKGLVSGVSSLSELTDYRIGSGLGDFEIGNNPFLQTVKNLNDFSCNCDNYGKNAYQKNNVLVTSTSLNDDSELNALLDNSVWVTILEPHVNLDYFYNRKDNLSVIHFSDQYTSTSHYDSITVSSKTEQYKTIVEEFLISATEHMRWDYDLSRSANNIMEMFNSLNGRWLLKILSNYSNINYQREKISTIAAVKILSEFLSHIFSESSIIWLSLSLEEVIRIAGVSGLKKEDGIFSAENLGSKGKHSDDLLFVGIEEKGEKLILHFYPVEVKIGQNSSNVKKKATEQILKTINLLRRELNSEENLEFFSLMYRHFFAQLIISTSERMRSISPKLYENIYRWRRTLLSGDYSLGVSLDEVIGAGGIVYFEKDFPYTEKFEMDFSNNVMNFIFKEIDAYKKILFIEE